VDEKIRTVAVQLAVLAFFIMAVTGWMHKCSPAACAARSLAGAGVMYAVIRIAGHLILSILINAMAESQVKKQTSESDS